MKEEFLTYETETEDSFILEAEVMKTLHEAENNGGEAWEHAVEAEIEDLVKDLSNAIRLNYYYGSKLGWDQYYDRINELLLPYSGMTNVSLGPEAFALALSEWQKRQGLSDAASDGILGPQTWSIIEPLIKTSYVPGPTLPNADVRIPDAPPVTDIAAFNAWHAREIAGAISAGFFGTAFDSVIQLNDLVNGRQVKNVDPHKQIVAILPIIYHILINARVEGYTQIIIGSFLRGATNGVCTGHCAGRSIDINYRGSRSFETEGSAKMVANILRYLLTLPAQYRKKLGFGMPMQGQFFPKANFKKYSRVSSSLLINPDLRILVPQLGIVFPDNDNHLHIQVDWARG